jgi:hypothetical protein
MTLFPLFSKTQSSKQNDCSNCSLVFNRDQLDWFIGFAEGNGCLHTDGQRLWFILAQKEARILYRIRAMLGFGRIQQTAQGYWRYEVAHQQGIYTLITIFNGQLRSHHKQQQLAQWISVWNINQSKSKKDNNARLCSGCVQMLPFLCLTKVSILPQNTRVSIDNAWVSGFIDAEGGFSISMTNSSGFKNGVRIRPRMFCDQKNERILLQQIAIAFVAGRVTERKLQKKHFGLDLQLPQLGLGISNTDLENQTNGETKYYRWMLDTWCHVPTVMRYFRRYPLQTRKHIVYLRWIKIYRMYCRKEHLTPEGVQRIRVLSLGLNRFNSVSKTQN